VIEGEHGEHPDAAAHALHAEILSLQVCRVYVIPISGGGN
jgi:hypothetical protein